MTWGRIFGSKEAVLDFCYKTGLIPDPNSEPNCKVPRCTGKYYKIEDRASCKIGWRFRCQVCGHKIIPTKDTWFKNIKLDYEQALFVAFCFVCEEPICRAILQIDVNKNTGTNWYGYVRKVAEVIISNEFEKIGGIGKIVECDETHICSRKFHRGRYLRSGQVWVFGGICREDNSTFFVEVSDRTRETLMTAMQKYIHPDSFIVTDSWRSYEGLTRYGFAYHEMVNHKKGFLSKHDKTINTQKVERLWRSVKQDITFFGRKDQSDEVQGHAIASELAKHGYMAKFIRPLEQPGLRFERICKDISRVFPGPFGKGLELRKI